MTVTGVVTSVGPQWQGSTLVAEAAAASVTLAVDNAGDFEDFTDGPPPQPRFLSIGADPTPREYVDSQQDDDDPQTLTLADPLEAGFEASLPVYLWDPTSTAPDKRAVQFRALVVLDDQPDGDPVRASIDLEQVPLAEAYALEGARVSLVRDDEDGEWWVDRIRGRSPRIDSDVIATPKGTGLLASDTPWGSGFITITNFAVLEAVGVTFDAATGIWTFTTPGEWFVKFDFGFEANLSGIRVGLIRIHNLDGTFEEGSVVKDTPVEARTAMQVIDQRFFAVGQGVSFLARQSSGGDLNLLGSNGNTAVRPTAVKFVRLAT